MKNLIQLTESLRILFIRSNLQTRTALVLCMLMLAVGLGLMVQNSNLLSNRMEYLLDGQDFTPVQLDQFELAFSNSSLRHYQRVGNRMQIPSANRDSYLKALAQAKCLPLHAQAPIDMAQDPLRFLEPRTVAQERERKERIRQIENTLKEFPFVRQATVTYDEKAEGFTAEKKRAATVAIHPKNNPHLTRSQRRSIIRLVHMHFPGLKASEVVLVDLALGETFTEPSLDSNSLGQLAQSDSHWTDRRREHEEEIKKKAMELLAGYGDVQIVVSSEPIGSETSLDTPTETDPEKTNTSPLPSTIPNRKARLGDALASKEILKAVACYTTRISVSIPTSYYQKAYRHTWSSASGASEPDASVGATLSAVASDIPRISDRALEQIKTQTVQAIREKLSPLVAASNLQASELEGRLVITDHVDSIEATGIQQAAWQKALVWLTESWRTLGLFATVLVAMLLLRSLASPKGLQESLAKSSSMLREEETASGGSLLDLQEHPISIEQETPLAKPSVTLSKKVQTQPEQVASRLATWISQN